MCDVTLVVDKGAFGRGARIGAQVGLPLVSTQVSPGGHGRGAFHARHPCSLGTHVEIPADSLIGEEGKGFAYILDGMNAERILVASESVGDGHWFIE